ncbi:MAG: SpoIIIAH-like family protein [Anaerovoracaceae bacterium]
MNNSNNDNEKKNASEEKQRILGYMETELAIESIIEQKNLPDSFVLITESSISVTVDQQDLDTSTVAKICDIVMRETGESADKIITRASIKIYTSDANFQRMFETRPQLLPK